MIPDNYQSYRVKVEVIVWADNKKDAVDIVYSDLHYLTECDGGISGFEHPTEADAREYAFNEENDDAQ